MLQDEGPPAQTSPGTAGCVAWPPSPSSGAAAPTPLASGPSLDVCPFLSTSAPLESQPFCCAHTPLLESRVPSPSSLCEGKLLPPPPSQHSRPLASSPFQPRPGSTGHNSLCGTWTEDEVAASWPAPFLAPCTPNQEANPHQLPPRSVLPQVLLSPELRRACPWGSCPLRAYTRPPCATALREASTLMQDEV